MIHKRIIALKRSVEGGLHWFYGANLTVRSDMDQYTYLDILFAWKNPNLSLHYLQEHINQVIKRR